MAFFNKPELKRAAGFPNAAIKAISESRRELKWLPFGTEFDIFLSHCFRDLEYLLGLKNMLEEMEYTVYTDWDADSDLNRRAVTSDTAQVLRQRMKDCRCLFYAVSDTSSESKWMPWELGYSDGLHGKVAILPVVDRDEDSEDYRGLEYLGLYPYVVKMVILGRLTMTSTYISQKTSFFIS